MSIFLIGFLIFVVLCLIMFLAGLIFALKDEDSDPFGAGLEMMFYLMGYSFVLSAILTGMIYLFTR